MAANDTFYKKYGGFATPDMAALTSGQAAVDRSVAGVFQGVKDLLTQTEDIYKENNTLNMQEYLKGKLQEDGLGAKPMDKEAIRKNFGNMINMDKLVETYAGEKQQMETDALNAASVKADQVLTETGDVLAAHQKLKDTLVSEYNAPADMVSHSLQSWSDANAVGIKDAEIQKLRDEETLYSQVRAAEAQGLDAFSALEAGLVEFPEYDKETLREKLIARLDAAGTLTQQQQATQSYFLKNQEIANAKELSDYDIQLSGLEAQYNTALQTGINSSFVDLAKKYNSTLGSSPVNAIIERLDNWAEGIVGYGEGQDIKKLYNKIKALPGMSLESADAILLQAFNANYRGDDIAFNDMDQDELDNAKLMAMKLAREELSKKEISAALSQARVGRTLVEEKGLRALNDLSYNMTRAGQREKLGAPKTPTMQAVGQQETSTPAASPGNKGYKKLAPALQQKMVSAEKQYGLPAGFLARTAELESSNDPTKKNPKSSATGLFQFIDSTAAKYNLTDPTDPAASIDAAARLARDNTKILSETLGRAPTSAELYLAQLQGATGAAKLLSNPDALAVNIVGTKEVINNAGQVDMTAKEYTDKWLSKFGAGASAETPPPPSNPLLSDDIEERKKQIAARAEKNKNLAPAGRGASGSWGDDSNTATTAKFVNTLKSFMYKEPAQKNKTYSIDDEFARLKNLPKKVQDRALRNLEKTGKRQKAENLRRKLYGSAK